MNKAIAQVKELEVKEAQARAMADIASALNGMAIRIAAIEAQLTNVDAALVTLLSTEKPDGVQKDEATRRGR
jgi:hypothetical protein